MKIAFSFLFFFFSGQKDGNDAAAPPPACLLAVEGIRTARAVPISLSSSLCVALPLSLSFSPRKPTENPNPNPYGRRRAPQIAGERWINRSGDLVQPLRLDVLYALVQVSGAGSHWRRRTRPTPRTPPLGVELKSVATAAPSTSKPCPLRPR